MGKKYPYKRKMLNLSVNRRLQFRMIGRITGILFVCLLISSGFYFYYSNMEIGASFKMFHIKARNFLDLLLPAVIFSFLLSLVMGVIASLFFPKTYAGALYRIEQDLKKVLGGDLTQNFKLRRGDEGEALIGQLNELTGNYSQLIIKLRRDLGIARQLCSDDGARSAEQKLIEVEIIHAQLLQMLEQFKVEE